MSMRNCAARKPWAVRPVVWQRCLKTTAAFHENKPPAVAQFRWNGLPHAFIIIRWEFSLWLFCEVVVDAVGGTAPITEDIWTLWRVRMRRYWTNMCCHCNSQWQFASGLWMHWSKVRIFKRKHHGRSGYNCFRVGCGDYCRVAAVQRCGADLFSVQPGDPQTGSRSLYSQLDVLQPVVKCVQHAANCGWAPHHGPPRRQRLLSNCGFPRYFSHHKLNAQYGCAQHW